MFTSLMLTGALAIGQPPALSVQPLQPVQGPTPLPSPAPFDPYSHSAGWYSPNQFATPAQGQVLGVLNVGVPTVAFTPQSQPPMPQSPQPQTAQSQSNQPPATQTPAAQPGKETPPKNGDSAKGTEKDADKPEPNKHHWLDEDLKPKNQDSFASRLYGWYFYQTFPSLNPNPAPPEEEAPRRALPSPFPSPPYPGNEYQGYPLIGINPPIGQFAFMQALYGGPYGQAIKDSGITFEGWATMEGNSSTARNSNTPTSYWIRPNAIDLDQLVFKFERIADTVQQDHIDWGFRSVIMYGIDYRYTMAGGWGSAQIQAHNSLYGWDPTEQYFNVYVPGFLGGTDIRVGRWIACPDIETQYSVNNYMGSHSILFTYDTYTNTGIMLTQKINDQWTAQFALTAGTDMAPWYQGAIPTFGAGLRWVSKDNNDSFYTWLNQCNDAQFRHFSIDGNPTGHDNFNYVVTTWEHKFSDAIHTETEAYIMWEYNAEVGGTPSYGPLEPYGGGGGDGKLIPGRSLAYGVLNYTEFGITDRDYITVRNEWFRDETGFRTGFKGNYTSNSIGLSHQFNDYLMLRPEIGFYRNWTENAFDNGTKRNLFMAGFDLTFRF